MLLLANLILTLWISTVGGQRNCLKTDLVIENGFLSEVEHTYPFGKEAQYKCKLGYKTTDGKASDTVKCLQDGWSTQPICTKSCDMPVLVNARHRGNSTWFMLNEKLEYECEDGYVSGDGHTAGSTLCGEEGWSHLPMCYEKECPVPLLDVNVDVHPKQEKYRVGDLIKFSCRRRLLRVGADSTQCYLFGWSPNFPTCKEQVQSCGPPPQLPNGKVKEGQKEEYKHSEMVEYNCNPDFIMKGPKKIQCMDGEWTTLPTCVEQLETCEYLPELKHGYVPHLAPPYQHGVSVALTCKKTYTMIGNSTVTCISGTWTEFPTCVATHELKNCTRSKLGTRIFRPYLTEFNHNAIINYKCFGTHKYSQTVCVNGKWEPEPNCTERKKDLCPPPPQIPNAENMVTTVNYQDGEKVAVLCKNNYLLSEAKDIVCKNGHWQSLPQCIESEEFCGPPPPTENGNITSFQLWTYPPGSTVDYHCQAFYKPEGSTKAKCQNGQWSDPPKCLEMTCKPPHIPNGIYSPQRIKHRTEDEIRYECKDGFHPTTRESISKCTSIGWVPAPTCSLKPCDFPQLNHGHLYYEERYRPYFPVPIGKKFSYYCNNGFVTFSGSYWDYIHCTEKGWDPEKPCRKQCVFHSLENGHSPYWEKGYLEDQTVEVKCYPGYTLPNGQNTITCTENGWSPPPKCVPVNK